jgi:hypothetical protein
LGTERRIASENKLQEANKVQVKSKERVAVHGEVFTADREVNAMLDLVKSETERIESRFLEPACGNGNFLAKILERKLAVVRARYGKEQNLYERNALLAVSSIYGIEIQMDNVMECRERLLEIFKNEYLKIFHEKYKQECLKSVEFLLSKNILWGDALNYCEPTSEHKLLKFSEWSFLSDGGVKRRDYTYKDLVNKQFSVFSDLGEESLTSNPNNDYPLVNYLNLNSEAYE